MKTNKGALAYKLIPTIISRLDKEEDIETFSRFVRELDIIGDEVGDKIDRTMLDNFYTNAWDNQAKFEANYIDAKV